MDRYVTVFRYGECVLGDELRLSPAARRQIRSHKKGGICGQGTQITSVHHALALPCKLTAQALADGRPVIADAALGGEAFLDPCDNASVEAALRDRRLRRQLVDAAKRLEERIEELLEACAPGEGRVVVSVPELLYIVRRLEDKRLLPLDFDFDKWHRIDDCGSMRIMRGQVVEQ